MQTLHMIANAHIDPVWLWNWQEGFQEIKVTFRSALDRLTESPDFFFVASSAAFYEFIEENDPDMFAEIKARVKEGRWELLGGWWVEPDVNIPSGESLVRQGLYGQRYFKAKFGKQATVGFCPDSFGHAASLPQILQKSGLDSYCFLRPKPEEKELPGPLFWWESGDGSRVLTFRIPNEYCTPPGADLTPHIEKCEMMCFYGVGNHGGGPTKQDIEWIRTQEHLQFSTPSRFFAEADTSGIPTVKDELQNHARGCYSAHSGVKRWNRKAENLLGVAERFSAIAHAVVRLPYPDFERAWKDVLFNQFHDILAGTSLESCYDDARDLYGEAMSIASKALNHALQALAWQIHIPEEEAMLPIVVFNPHPWEATLPVELEWRALKGEEDLLDDEDTSIPFQLVRSEATVAKGRSRLAFLATLPPLGYRVYRMKPSPRPVHEFVPPRFHAPKSRARVYEDRSDTWSHDVKRYDQPAGDFEEIRCELMHEGPSRLVTRRVSRYGQSTLIQDEIQHSGQEYLEVRCILDWREQWKAFKLEFKAQDGTSKWEIPFGHIHRVNDGTEQPGQSWLESGAVALINDCKHGFSVTQDAIQMTVLRSPVYAHHDPYVPEEGQDYRFIDQGEQRFAYIVAPAGAGVPRLAAQLNAPAIALRDTFHKGPLPMTHSFGQVDSALLSALKVAEDGHELVVRVWNPENEPRSAYVRVLGHDVDLELKPFEVQTLRLGKGPVSMLET